MNLETERNTLLLVFYSLNILSGKKNAVSTLSTTHNASLCTLHTGIVRLTGWIHSHS